MEEIFTEIYEKGIWNPKPGGEGISGWGSVLENNLSYIQFLELFLHFNKITSIIDLGCGDWSFSKEVQWGDRRYLGIDIVQGVIEKNKSLFSSQNISFLQANAIEIDLPEADLLLCKDVLMHLSNRAIFQLLKQFEKYKHCLITNTMDRKENRDIPTGGFRPLDLTEAPFLLKGLKVFTYQIETETKQVLYLCNK